jgi:phosphopantetheinyl transferase (holo-ACP synthase)
MNKRIFGIGVDLVNNVTIQNVLNRHYAEGFVKKFLHEEELKRYFTMKI